jgi:hypothetical protein
MLAQYQRMVRNNIFPWSCLVVVRGSLTWVAQHTLHTLNNLNINCNIKIIEDKKSPCKCITTIGIEKFWFFYSSWNCSFQRLSTTAKFSFMVFVTCDCWLLHCFFCHMLISYTSPFSINYLKSQLERVHSWLGD